MIFTDKKIETLRTAVAESLVTMSAETLKRVGDGTVPKGNPLELARAAGVLAAKKTAELIPYCHPIPLDGVSIDFEMKEKGILVRATVTAVWKTGVEMEALTAVTVAALTLYDMCKPIDKGMEIASTKLLEKSGGKSTFREKFPKELKAAVVVTSDGTHAGKREDKSGKIIREKLSAVGIGNVETIILPDEKDRIATELLRLCREGTRLIVTTGGTGLGPRDVTVEATREVIDREIPGVAEAMRSFGQRRTPYAMLSRGVAGLKGGTIIVNLPGSSRGAAESMDALFPALLHSYKMMEGGGH